MPPQQPPQSAPKGSKVSSPEWALVVTAAAMIDIVQLVLDFMIIGAVLNRGIDIVVGLSLALYFFLRGVKLDLKRLVSFFGTVGGELVPGVDALPLWTLDVLAMMAWDKLEKKGLNLPI